MFDYDDMAATALDLITEFGADVQFGKMIELAGSKPWLPGQTQVPTVTVKGVILPMTGSKRESARAANGGVDVVGNAYAILPSFEHIPSKGDFIIAGGERLVIEASVTISPAGTPVCHEVYLVGRVTSAIGG